MSLKKRLAARFPAIYDRATRLKIMIRERSLKPSKIMLLSGNSIFVNWNEPRGFAILKNKAAGQPYVKNLWNTIIKAIKPDIILDCGANYGELVFLSNYTEGQKAIAIEADPKLFSFLNKSLQVNNNKDKIKIVNALLTASSGGEQLFYIDESWSGRSTAVKNHNFEEFTEVLVPKISIDQLLESEKIESKMIFFKIDVEGYEQQVLEGMRRTIASAKALIGIVEFNLKFLLNKTDNLEEYLSMLSNNFEIALINKTKITFVDNLTKEVLNKNKGFNDILIYTKNIEKEVKKIISKD